MARHDLDGEEGWAFFSMTKMKAMPPEKQLKIYARKVSWSKVNQLRSTLETYFTCEEVFDHLLTTFGDGLLSKYFKKYIDENQAKAQDEKYDKIYPYVHVGDESVTALSLRNIPFPWPLSQRYCFIVQDYQMVRDDESSWFYTYNHDIDHPYFNRRDGFVRLSVKFQGLVGVPTSETCTKPVSIQGHTNTTRLTWLVNMDYGGLVPIRFFQHVLQEIMFLPSAKVIEMEHCLNLKSSESGVKRGDFSSNSSDDGALPLKAGLDAVETDVKTLVENHRLQIESMERELAETRAKLARVTSGNVRQLNTMLATMNKTTAGNFDNRR